MKVAMLLDNPFTNDARVYKEAKSLVDNGYDVTIICKLDYDKSLPCKEVVDGIKIKRLFKYNLGTSVLIDKYLYAHIDLFNNLNESYDIYHCHDTETWPIGYILSKRDNAKLVFDSHEYFLDHISRWWHKDQFKYEFATMLSKARGNYIRYADKVITVSEPISEELKSMYDLKEKPTVLYNTRHYTYIQNYSNEIREKYNVPNDTNIILFQGNIEFTRGVDIAIECMKHIEKAVLMILGKGINDEYIEELKILARSIGVEDKVIFAGFISSDKLVQYCSYADMFVYFPKPHLKNNEYGMPNKFFDYIFAAKPMVVSNIPSFSQFLNKYKIGELIDIDNVNIENISNTIKNLLKNNKKREEYISNMKKIQKFFCWEEQEKKLISLYNELSVESDKL